MNDKSSNRFAANQSFRNMKKNVFRYVKHISITFITLALIIGSIGLYHGASLRYSENPVCMNWDKDGPYVFFNSDSMLTVNYIRGNKTAGFYTDKNEYNAHLPIPATCFFPLDSTYFKFVINNNIAVPANSYMDNAAIIAISDMESSFYTFRDFLINNKVINKNLDWIFGNGHLVLLGDFVDRDFSATQVLWFIYKLEQAAKEKGGTVHYILGNHELKNMQGNFESASPKYFHIASILQKQQVGLYDSASFIGRWMSSKNTIEQINGILFAHGGMHPGLMEYNTNLNEINNIIRANYYAPYYPKAEKNLEQLLTSTHSGIAWYRGYFKENITQDKFEKLLATFNASAIVVGHTIQSSVHRRYKGKLVAIDVKHPKDYSKSFPFQHSEGILIEGNQYYRVLHTGEKKKI